MDLLFHWEEDSSHTLPVNLLVMAFGQEGPRGTDFTDLLEGRENM